MTAARMIRNSERRDMKRCPARWDWAWNSRLKANRMNTKLWMGIGVHEALAEWYQTGAQRGPHPVQTWLEYCDSEDSDRSSAQYEDEEVTWTEIRELGEDMLTNYVDFWGQDRDWDVIATEQDFQVLLPRKGETKVSHSTALAQYVGTFDGVYRSRATGELWLMEHKTAAGIDRFVHHIPLDDQANAYYWAATQVLRSSGLIGRREELDGIMYNFLLKYKPAESTLNRPQNAEGLYLNKDGSVSKIQVKPMAERFVREPAYRSRGDRLRTLEHLQDEVKARQNFLDGVTPIYKNPTFDCSWDCAFYRMCQLHESKDDWEEYRDLVFTTDDPYRVHAVKSA